MRESREAFCTFLEEPTGTLSSHFIRTHYPRSNQQQGKFVLTMLVSFLCVFVVVLSPTKIHRSAQAFTAKTPKAIHDVTVTAYTNVPSCTDSTPDETASLLKIKPKHYWRIVALSRDLAKQYKFGDKFELRVDGRVYFVEFQDVMAKRHKEKIDFLLPSVKKCMRFGVNRGILIPIDSYGQDMVQQAG